MSAAGPPEAPAQRGEAASAPRVRGGRPRMSAGGARPGERRATPSGDHTKLRASQLGALSDALAAVLPLNEPADAALHYFFRRHAKLGQQDRAFIADGVFATLRRCARSAHRRKASAPRRLAVAVTLRELGLSLRELEGALSADERAWAGAFRARKPVLSGAETAELARLAVGSAGRRVSRGRTRCTHARVALARTAGSAHQSADDPARGRAGSAGRVRHHRRTDAVFAAGPAHQRSTCACNIIRLFKSGAIEVQDEGSQLLGFLVAPRRTDMVVDFCAGAGGKTLMLGALMRSQGRIYAFDVSARRLARLKPRLARSGLVQRAAGLDPERARYPRQAPRRQDRSCAGRRALQRASARCGAIPTSNGGRRRKASTN